MLPPLCLGPQEQLLERERRDLLAGAHARLPDAHEEPRPSHLPGSRAEETHRLQDEAREARREAIKFSDDDCSEDLRRL